MPLNICRPPPSTVPFPAPPALLVSVPPQGKLQEAEKLFRRALVNLRSDFESYPLQAATILVDLAGVLATQVRLSL